MDAGGTWQRLLHTPTTWIVVAVVLFVVAVVLLVAGARAGRAGRRAREVEAVGADRRGEPADGGDDDPVTEPALPRRDPAPSGPRAKPAAAADDELEEDPVTEPSVPRVAAAAPDESAAGRLLAALLTDPSAALAGVAALERGEDPGRAAVTLLRSGVPTPAVASLCGVAPGDLVAAALGVLPHDRSAPAEAPDTPEPAETPERAAAPMS